MFTLGERKLRPTWATQLDCLKKPKPNQIKTKTNNHKQMVCTHLSNAKTFLRPHTQTLGTRALEHQAGTDLEASSWGAALMVSKLPGERSQWQRHPALKPMNRSNGWPDKNPQWHNHGTYILGTMNRHLVGLKALLITYKFKKNGGPAEGQHT